MKRQKYLRYSDILSSLKNFRPHPGAVESSSVKREDFAIFLTKNLFEKLFV